MNNPRTLGRRALGVSLALTVSSLAAFGQALVKNPSFESNLNDETDPLSAGAPQGWPYYSPIDEWVSGGGGVNDLVYDPGGPFHNAGTPVPDGRRIGFKQGGGAVSQDIYGLVAGQSYWIQFHYDARNGSDLDIAVQFATVNFGGAMDEQLAFIPKVRPAIATGSPYYYRTVPFTPDFEIGTLSFVATARGDSTMLLDGVTIVARDTGNFPVMNPSFEASGVVFDGSPTAGTDWRAISGWVKTGVAGVDDGTGGQADNGSVPEQALVAFIDGEGSLAQTLRPLVSGEQYQVQFRYNAKSGSTPHLQLRLGETVLWEQDVTPVGGGAAYRSASHTFTATSDTATLTFANTTAGATVLLDDIKVLGKIGTQLPPFEMTPGKMLVRVGGEATGSITIPAERLAQGPAVMRLRSANANVFVLPDAAADGSLSLTFQNGNTTQPFKVRGVSVGNAAITIEDSAGLPMAADITAVFVAGGTFVLNPSFELDKDSGVATAPVAGWTTGGGNIGMAEAGNPFLAVDDLTIPDRQKVLRIQGGGTVSQMIAGLRPGQLYGLQFFYNARSFGYPNYEMALEVSFAGQQLGNFPSLMPAAMAGLTDYYFEELRFTPTEPTGLLEFKITVAAGDATLFLDGVSIVPRVAGEIAIKNSSFEGTAMGANWPGYIQPGRVGGWLASGGGYGVNAYSPKTFFVEPFLDNGINSDQDNAFFGQGSVTLRQTLMGLTPNQAYTLVLDYNYRDGRGQGSTVNPNQGQLEVSWDGSPVLTTENQPPVDTLSPWPGFRHTLPFYQAFIPVTAWADGAELSLAHIGVAGDETFLIDNVRLIPGTRTPPAITQGLVEQTAATGATVTFRVTASGSNLRYRWLQDGVPLQDGNGLSGTGTATLTLANVQAAHAGTYTVLVTDGVGVVGSAALLTVETPVTVSLTVARLANGNVRLAWPAASAFRLQSAAAVPGPYADDAAAVVVEGEENVVTLAPDGTARFFRLVN
ncbi:MAG: DUF642 domain-containing protein [Verrucomicrobiales bacterium]|nr:DUF642 domain-containing protein [Verrucomicrobiales bacterium]